MRRAVAASIALGAVCALAGCAGRPPGTDGDLTNGWPIMPQAKVPVPVAGVCYPGQYVAPGRIVRVWSEDVNTVDCATSHYSETAFVGTLTGADAQRAAVPDTDGPAMPAVYDQCGRDKMLKDRSMPVVAAFLGYQSVSQWHNQAVGWWSPGWDEDEWNLGDLTTQCFAYAFTKSGKFVGSVKGIRDQTPKG